MHLLMQPFCKLSHVSFKMQFSFGKWYEEMGSIPCKIVVVYVYVCIYVSYTYSLFYFFLFLWIKFFLFESGLLVFFFTAWRNYYTRPHLHIDTSWFKFLHSTLCSVLSWTSSGVLSCRAEVVCKCCFGVASASKPTVSTFCLRHENVTAALFSFCKRGALNFPNMQSLYG